MRKSARAGAAEQSAALSAESAMSRPASFKLSTLRRGFSRVIFDAKQALSTLPRARLSRRSRASRLAVEPPVGPRGADHYHLAQPLARQKADDPAGAVGDGERRGSPVLQALEQALDRRRGADALHARTHEGARRFVMPMLAHR